MAILTHKNKTILKEMKYATSIIDISKGLMFASIDKVKNGMCLVLPSRKNQKFQSSVTMLFCFYPYEIIFVNAKFEVVDKTLLKPWKLSYTPKKPCKYVIESWDGTFKNIKIGDKVEIKF